MSNRSFLVAASLLAPVLIFSAGYFLGVRGQRTEIKTEYKDRVVYQDRIVYRDRTKAETKVKERVIEKPDGTRITEKSASETKTAQTEGRRNTEVQRDVQTNSSRSIPSEGRQSNYSASVHVDPRTDFRVPKNYSLGLGRRLIGPLWGEITGDAKGNFSLGLRIEW
jgi:hypothetical protein